MTSPRILRPFRARRTTRAPRWGRARLLVAFVGVAVTVLGGAAAAAPPAQASPVTAGVGQIHAPIVGSGSTWSANALQQWIRNVWSNYQWRITYSESGSTQGRNDFRNGTADFGVSEIPYAIQNSNEADSRPPRGFAYMPIVAGGTAFMYNLEIGGRRVTNLRLSGEVIAKIFTNQIKEWNHPEIQADNPALSLPAIPIVPVVRSDGSGTSAQFSMWMRQEHPDIWDAYCHAVGRPLINGHCGITSNYPVIPGSGFQSRAGANGVAGYVRQGHAVGSITFVEYSYALNARFPVVKMLNRAGYYSEPTHHNVAVALLAARINEDQNSIDYLTQDLSQVYINEDPRAYPLSSYSYIILPTRLESGFTLDKGRTLADFGAYFLCEGQQQAEVLGYSPLPINLVQAGQQQIQKIPGGDPVIKGINDCNNPTFSPDGSNRLANEAPMPPECDRRGPEQCLTGTGGARDVGTDASGGGSGGAGGGAGPGGGAEGGRAGGGGAAGDAADDVAGPGGPAAGGVGGAGVGDAAVITADAAPVTVAATPQAVAVADWGLAWLAMAAAGAALLAAAALPPFLGRRARRAALPVDP
ncbi:phosphate ABC transporter substrate-binding protein PstS [Microbacterium album]|uniref:PBP domain-containing protein n=1 Tax=Microbacterium album TaxID=2053191 RepID=A0A917IJK2_9MICO|nr:phosphate ABC transporter substrate-binding protein PstS [Microbacterium album]GGH51126.1 hypothetical protein GCM10010921_30350 [Microbacterium album]